ncbi:YbaK/EbsC family protein [Pleomorphomonas carboxyditropha]|uniref:Cys-tRNA(Pro)/cys-tRNA(Cys) deacylase n=1 Tax=Pleomorphomonas carboxyditropha TaxID=2023338 RepID=A0A2G9WR62_9HYPH|nr:YbaK/EbsC family protein [Pleomorphomonas carboxyditropha]PIO97207.1 cys-tRNA(pro)/cys-tRNA(cys) deacylase [Pleomorphomonas carboxyditropha]
MSLASVKAFFAEKAPDIAVIETDASSATVAEAAAAHGVDPAEIAKTICLRVGDQAMLLVAGGTARLDNRKAREAFGGKARMLGLDEVVELTGHPIGGVCPFGLKSPLPVYCDLSLRRFAEVLPAAGATNAAVRIGTERLAELIGATWVDVCQ